MSEKREFYKRRLFDFESENKKNLSAKFFNRVNIDLMIAREMQERIIPSLEVLNSVKQQSGCDIEDCIAPSSYVGGDMWYVLDPNNQYNPNVLLADFSGHGVSAAINVFKLHLILQQMDDFSLEGNFLERLNGVLYKDLIPLQFASMLHGYLDQDDHVFLYKSAGNPPPMVLLPDGEVIIGDGSGMPIGLVEEVNYDIKILPAPPGATIFLFTDDLVDNLCDLKTGDTAYIQHILRISESHKDIIDRFKKITAELHEQTVEDDLAMLVIKRPG